MRTTLLVYLGFVGAFLYTSPYWEQLRNANEMPRVMLTEEMVDRGTFRLDERWAELSQGSTFDVAVTPDDHKYSNKAPGASLVGVPAYLAVKAYHRIAGGQPKLAEVMWACRFAAALLPVLCFLPVFRRTARRFASEPASDAALLALALGSMVFPYGHLLFSHALAAACAGGAFALAVDLTHGETRRPLLTAVAVGFLLGWAVLADYQALVVLVPVVAYVAVRRFAALGAVIAGGAPPALLLGYYHWACFGAPWRTGYSFAADQAHREGVLGVIGPNHAAIAQALTSFDNGLLVLMPWVALAVVGAVVLCWRRGWRAEAITCAVAAGGVVLFVGSLVPEFGRAGWSVGPRYVAVAMPFFAWLAAGVLEAVDRRPVLRTIAHALILVSVAIMVVAVSTFPYWPTEVRNPVYEVAFWALGKGYVAPSLGTRLGLHGAASAVPLFVLAAVLSFGLLGRGQRGRMVTTLAAAAVAALAILALGRAPRTFDLPTRRDYLSKLWTPGALF